MSDRLRRLIVATGALAVMVLAGPQSADARVEERCVFCVEYECPQDLTVYCQLFCEEGDPEDDYSAAECVREDCFPYIDVVVVYCYGQM